MKKASKGKVFVGMSGGVDSSVSAALLKSAGYDVTGVFIKVWHPEWAPCTWKDDRRDAMRVAAQLDIPFLTLNLEEEYKKEVVEYMIDEYKKGRTPNPDVMCNKTIKFGGFLKNALEQGSNFVATGHYAQVKDSEMITSKDAEKDQTYFLWTLTKEQLSKTLFPIGHLTKPEVRRLAAKYKLPTFDKKDSQGLCFIGKVDMKDFLKRYLPDKPGDVVDTTGTVIGRHDGAYFYTLGERHGFTITAKGTSDTPYYVVKKDIAANTLIVSHQNVNDNTFKPTEIKIGDVVDRSSGISKDKTYQARIRYRQPLQNCLIQPIKNSKWKLTFTEPQQSVSSGQSVVVYDGQICIGGGIIE